MDVKVRWNGEVSFAAESGTGHTVMMDGPAEKGGQNLGARPMELLLMGMGGCTSFDVVSMLKKSRQQITSCVAEIHAERADAVPAVFTKIHVHFVVEGVGLSDSHVKRAVSLSAEKYCSASIMLQAGGVEVTHSYALRETPV